MEPTKRGNFFHIESVRPMTEEGTYFSVSQYSTYAIARLGCTALFERVSQNQNQSNYNSQCQRREENILNNQRKPKVKTNQPSKVRENTGD